LRKRGLPPLLGPGIETLVLGSFPSVASLAAREYYAHPQNHFWKIIAALAGATGAGGYGDRTRTALNLGIGIWDVVAACEREGSGDERIVNARINDFSKLRALAPRLRRVCFNGQMAARLGRPVFETLNEGGGRAYEMMVLPSTSPRHARMTLAEKTWAWKQAVLKGKNQGH